VREKELTGEKRFPVHETIEVLEGKSVYKTERWWLAVLKVRSFGRTMVSVYLWKNVDGRWKRQQKISFRDRETWEKVRRIIDGYLKS